jgi:hypothetical protein
MTLLYFSHLLNLEDAYRATTQGSDKLCAAAQGLLLMRLDES